MCRCAFIVVVGLLCGACASSPRGGDPNEPILTQSTRISSWPVESETVPGLWFRLGSSGNAPPSRELIESLQIVVEHGQRRQEITGSAFSLSPDGSALYQTRYLYLPTSGVLFITLKLRTAAREFFPDTQRIELNGDCWHMVSYRVRGPITDAQPTPPPYPRTILLTAALSPDPQLYLEIFLSGNCFRNPLPPH